MIDLPPLATPKGDARDRQASIARGDRAVYVYPAGRVGPFNPGSDDDVEETFEVTREQAEQLIADGALVLDGAELMP